MRPLRIGLVIDRLDPARGGAEAYLVALARFLAGNGHRVEHLASRFGPGVDAGTLRTVTLPPLPRFLRDAAFDRAAARLAVDLGLDVTLGVRHTPSTHVFQPHGGVYSCAASAQSRSAGRHWRRHAVARALNPKHRALVRLEAQQRRRADRVTLVALSDRVADDMRAVYRPPSPRAPIRIYNGVDAGRFRPDPSGEDRARLRRRHAIPADAFLALFVGHNFRLKGLHHLLDALAQAGGDTRLLVIGRGRDRPFRERAAGLGLGGRVVFAGMVDDAAPLYRAADVLAHPTYYDPCSCVCLEALASGLPVITTGANGVGELITAAGGGLVLDAADDVAGLAAAINALRGNPAQRIRLATEARDLAVAWPEAKAFASMEAVLVETANREAGKRGS